MATATIIDFLLNQQRNSSSSLVGGSVTFYAAGTTNLKDIWLDNIQTQVASNPYLLDSRASAILYGSGNYKIVLKDSTATTVATWDNVYVGADLSSIDLSSIIAAASFTNRDYIGNSQFNIWNFGISFVRTTAVDTQTADGWFLSADGSDAGTNTVSRQTFTFGQPEVPENPSYYSRLTRSVATTGATYEHYAFRLPVQAAAGLEMTLRFYAKFAVTAAVTVVCKQYFGSGGSTTVTTTSAGINIADAWAKYTKTFTVPSIASKTIGVGAYMEIGISLPVNANYTFSIASLKFEKGTVASDNEYRTTYEDDFRTSGKISSQNRYLLYDPVGGTNEKYWDLAMDFATNVLYLSALNDAQTTRSNVLKATMSGGVITSVETAVSPSVGTSDKQLATTEFVAATAFVAALPGQTGNSGKLVTTNGTDAGWLAPATQSEAETGTNNTAWATPLRVFQSIAAKLGNSFVKFTGPTTSDKTFTLPDANATIATAGLQTCSIPAKAMSATLTNGATARTAETSTNKKMIIGWDFDAATTQYVEFEIPFPKSWDKGTVTALFKWCHVATTTNFGTAFGLSGVAISNGETQDVAQGTVQLAVDTGGTTNYAYTTPVTSAITIAGSPTDLDTVCFRVQRKVDNAGDTMAVNATLTGIQLFYTTIAATDA
jgi:hypothetical protein